MLRDGRRVFQESERQTAQGWGGIPANISFRVPHCFRRVSEQVKAYERDQDAQDDVTFEAEASHTMVPTSKVRLRTNVGAVVHGS